MTTIILINRENYELYYIELLELSAKFTTMRLYREVKRLNLIQMAIIKYEEKLNIAI